MGAVAGATPQAEEKAFEFEHGLYGFPSVHRYVVTEIPGGGDIFKQMVALDQPGLAFTLVYPFAFFPDYAVEITEADLKHLGAERADQVIVMAIATVPAQFKDTAANLKAPLLFNPHTRKARQVILSDDRYTTRHRLFKA